MMKEIQQRNKEWIIQVFGQAAFESTLERCYRAFEEMTELCQACGFDKDNAQKIIDYVYARPAGDPASEVGGAFLSFTAFVENLGLDAGEELAKEMTRVQEPEIIERCRQRFLEKTLAGVATGLICDVCNKRLALGVASSCFAPVSHAYCAECLQKPADALPVFLHLYFISDGDIEQLNPAIKIMHVYIDDGYMPVSDFFAYLKDKGETDPRFRNFLIATRTDNDEPTMGEGTGDSKHDPVDPAGPGSVR
jgi:hypothetical protein